MSPVAQFGRRLAAFVLAIGSAFPVHSYESDVHFGLTRWLALKAGYPDWQARAIAMGNFRVDSGSMSTLALVPEYACFGKNEIFARDIQERHYPSMGRTPADPQTRTVEAGGPAARERLTELLQEAKGKESEFLGLFGAALHPLQDSWAHAGVPTVPALGPLRCDARLAGAPPIRASGDPHGADLTFASPASTVAMAKATYEALTAFPSVKGERRVPQDWSSLERDVRTFADARSKTAKRDWFMSKGITETDFLEGITLPDGPKPGSLHFDGRQLPALTKASSMQYGAPSDAREFFDRLIVRWLGKEPLETVVADLAKPNVNGATASGGQSSTAAQLTARLKVWKLRDHGTSARLAHLTRPFSPAEIAQVNALGKQPAANVEVAAEQAFFPLVIQDPTPSPLLPYIVHILPAQELAATRAIAIARVKHAPHDTIGFIAEKSSSGWALVDVVSVVDQ